MPVGWLLYNIAVQGIAGASGQESTLSVDFLGINPSSK